MARQRGEDLLAVHNPAAIGNKRGGAKGGLAGGRVAAFREGLCIDGAIIKDPAIMAGSHLGMFGALCGAHIDTVRE